MSVDCVMKEEEIQELKNKSRLKLEKKEELEEAWAVNMYDLPLKENLKDTSELSSSIKLLKDESKKKEILKLILEI